MNERLLAVVTLSALMGGGFLAPSPGWGAPIHYDESEDGDLLGVSSIDSSTVLHLSAGNNRISGTVLFIANSAVPTSEWINDADAFWFVVPEGLNVKSIRLSWRPADLEPGTSVLRMTCDIWWRPDPLPTDHEAENCEPGQFNVLQPQNNVEPFSDLFPLPAAVGDRYHIFFQLFATRGLPGQWAGGSVDYRWSIQVVPEKGVPEPGMGLLTLLGALSLSARRGGWLSAPVRSTSFLASWRDRRQRANGR